MPNCVVMGLAISKTRHYSSEQKEFADDNFKVDENGRKFSKRIEKTPF